MSSAGSIVLPEKLVMIAQGSVMRIQIFARMSKSCSLKKPILRRMKPITMIAMKLPARRMISSMKRRLPTYSLISSYSLVPRPIFSAWSRQARHSDSGVEFLNGSPQSAKPGFLRLSQS